MKKFVCLALCLVMFSALSLGLVACVQNPETTDSLVVYNWADYIYDYEEDFKAYYKNITGKNIEISYVTFDTNETMITKITKGDSIVDVMCPSEYAIQKLLETDWLVPLNYFDEQQYAKDISNKQNYVHNSKYIDQNIVDKIDEAFGEIAVGDKTVSMLDYMVPYMYGTLGILYNKVQFQQLGIYDVETLNKANWGILFNDDGNGNLLSQGLDGSILMKDSIRDSYAATLFYLKQSGKLQGTKYQDMPIGQLINAVDDTLIDLCKDVLTAQKSQLFGYEVDFGKDDLLKGNAMVDLAWSGDALYAYEESWNDDLNNGEGDYELSYYVPNGAGNIWFDGWVIPKTYNPEHIEAIKLFINFLNDPVSAAANMCEIGYTSAVDPEVVRGNADAMAVLAECYLVHGYAKDDNGDLLAEEYCDYATLAEFEEYFFDNYNEIDNSNWRYPFKFSPDSSPYKRDITTLGVMRDFGQNNKKVVTMWGYVRSAGVSALPLLLWTLAVIAVVAIVIAIVLLCKHLKGRYVVLSK